jgi:hypothetical protein
MQPEPTSRPKGRSRGRVVVSLVLGIALVIGSFAAAVTAADYVQSRLKSGTVIDVKTGKDLAKKKLKVKAVVKQGPLVPGVKRPLKVKLKNPYNEAVKVRQVTVKVKKPDATGCKKVWFHASKFKANKKHKAILIKPHKKAKLKLVVKLKNLKHVNQDVCKNTHVPLKVKAVARQA